MDEKGPEARHAPAAALHGHDTAADGGRRTACRSGTGLALHRLEHPVTGPEGGDRAIGDHQDLVDRESVDIRCVITTTVLPCAFSPLIASTKAFSPDSSRLELGSSRTMNDRIADSARASDALALFRPERLLPSAPSGVSIALRQAQDLFVPVGPLRRLDHFSASTSRNGDVLGHRAVEQFDVLRQVADVGPSSSCSTRTPTRRPAGRRPPPWARCRPAAGRETIARRARPTTATTSPGGDREGQFFRISRCVARSRGRTPPPRNLPARLGQAHALFARRVDAEQLAQPRVSLPAGDDLLPVGHQQFHRRQCAPVRIDAAIIPPASCCPPARAVRRNPAPANCKAMRTNWSRR